MADTTTRVLPSVVLLAAAALAGPAYGYDDCPDDPVECGSVGYPCAWFADNDTTGQHVISNDPTQYTGVIVITHADTDGSTEPVVDCWIQPLDRPVHGSPDQYRAHCQAVGTPVAANACAVDFGGLWNENWYFCARITRGAVVHDVDGDPATAGTQCYLARAAD